MRGEGGSLRTMLNTHFNAITAMAQKWRNVGGLQSGLPEGPSNLNLLEDSFGNYDSTV